MSLHLVRRETPAVGAKTTPVVACDEPKIVKSAADVGHISGLAGQQRICSIARKPPEYGCKIDAWAVKAVLFFRNNDFKYG